MLTKVRNVVLARMFVALSVGALWATTADASFLDRIYEFGDIPGGFEFPSDNAEILVTYDTEFLYINNIYSAYHDLTGTSGSAPRYVRTDSTNPSLSRPGARPTEWGASFNGTNQHLFINGLWSSPQNGNGAGGLGAPQQADNQFVYYDESNSFRVRNFDNITQRFIEGWVRPTGSGAAGRQDIVADTDQFTIFISAPDVMNKRYWGITHGPADTADDGEVTISSTEVEFGEWNHVMLRSTGGGGNDGVLYVNGVVVAVETQNYTTNPGAGTSAAAIAQQGWNYNFVLGAGVDKASNFFQGQLDNWNVGVSGTSNAGTQVKTGTPTPAVVLPAEAFGNFDPAVDNDFIKQALASAVLGDVNLDGNVTQADVDTFKQWWRTTKVVSGVTVFDLETRKRGDLDFNGVINLDDAFILREGLLAAGSGAVLDLSSLVPEPTSVMLAVFGMLSLVGVRRRRS